jgi:hypothetical protein
LNIHGLLGLMKLDGVVCGTHCLLVDPFNCQFLIIFGRSSPAGVLED